MRRARVCQGLAPCSFFPSFCHNLFTLPSGSQRGTSYNPSELKKEIKQLEGEKAQLTEKIAGLQRTTTGMEGFAPLLEATSSLRREQEEETKLQERMHEQRLALSHSEKRFQDATRRLAEARANTKQDVSAAQVLAAAEQEARETRNLANVRAAVARGWWMNGP